MQRPSGWRRLQRGFLGIAPALRFDHPIAHVQHLPTMEPFLTLLGKGLVTSHGELWRRQRQIIGVGFVGDVLDIAMDRGFEAGVFSLHIMTCVIGVM